MTPPTTVDPALTPEAVRNFQIASWIAVAGFVVVALVVWVLFVRPIVRLFVAVVRLFIPRHRYRRPRHRWVAPLRITPDYHEYVTGPLWKAKREELARLTSYRCKWPGCRVTRGLDCHHMGPEVYEHLGRESMDEIVFLCRPHHRQIRGPGPPLAVQQEFFGIRRTLRRSA